MPARSSMIGKVSLETIGRDLQAADLGHPHARPNLTIEAAMRRRKPTSMHSSKLITLHEMRCSLSILVVTLATSTACKVEDDGSRVGVLPDVPAPQLPESLFPQVDCSADGRTVAIGIPSEDAVHVVRLGEHGWERQGHVRAPARGFGFGARVTLSADGKTLAVSTAAEGYWFETVSIFGLSDMGTWEEQAQMGVPDPGDARGFDMTLSAEGDTMTMSPHLPGPGPMYVYRRDATNTWLNHAHIGDPAYFEQAIDLAIQHHEAAAYYDRSARERD